MKKPIWYKSPIESKQNGCPCCPNTESKLCLNTVMYNGFGRWSILKNSKLFFLADSKKEWDETETLKDIELMIGENDTDEFIAKLYLPLRGAKYQRHSKNHWVLIETGEGFA